MAKLTNAPNREAWLNSVCTMLRDHFEDSGYTIPSNVRMTCGFPSRSAISTKNQRIGECWSDSMSDGKVFEIFISPVLDNTQRVVDVLAHELIHATVGLKASHGPAFKKCATAIGLTGKMTATIAGPKFLAWYDSAKDAFPGDYPHERLNASNRPKKQTTRLVKCVCDECGYVARTTLKWIEQAGAPVCPIDGHGEMNVI